MYLKIKNRKEEKRTWRRRPSGAAYLYIIDHEMVKYEHTHTVDCRDSGVTQCKLNVDHIERVVICAFKCHATR